jgi:hypothetical protein
MKIMKIPQIELVTRRTIEPALPSGSTRYSPHPLPLRHARVANRSNSQGMLFTSEGGIPKMDIEARLPKLEIRYRALLSATVAAKANYRALVGEPRATAFAIERAKFQWQQLDARKRTVAAQMGELEELEQVATL